MSPTTPQAWRGPLKARAGRAGQASSNPLYVPERPARSQTPGPCHTSGKKGGRDPDPKSAATRKASAVTAPDVDLSRPSGARIYDFLIGGNGHYHADREMAGRLLEVYPGLRDVVREQRAFILKAAGWVARMKQIRQFIDLGCGLPAVPSVHATVREAAGFPSVCYVDHDPVVASHLRAALDGAGPGLAAVEADVSDPETVLADKGLLDVIDLSQPVCVILGGTLSGMDADVAGKAVAGYAEALAPGSAVIISCISYCDPELAARMAGVFGSAGTWRNHGSEDVSSFFDVTGLRLVHGRIMDVKCWPACPVVQAQGPDAQVIGGIGIRD